MTTECLYEGKAKRIYTTDQEGIFRVAYKDDATAFNGEKMEVLEGKGRLNNEISSLLFTMLHEKGVDNHFVERVSETEQLVRQVSIVPIEVVVRNIAAGSLVKRYGIERGTEMDPPLVEWYFKDDALGDPLMTDDHIRVMDLATREELAKMKVMALQVNAVLKPFFKEAKVDLIDFKLEFGKTAAGDILLADEISPDTCRLWDEESGESLDKDLFRFNQGNLQEGYEQLLQRLGGTNA
ncbi:phosphoribosylaminoimidazolesuccinocarboxamide synthase [Salisediminibacterium beveridgei]|uniref:Phosphoribosylaminoimidazole-succinocarboxamide synthase n=1 Tax=Salisediminibacterium beveridgei TaxID=632773 RepID=A0A1D7QY76_9BACI|nr:phosphoribosylaminoimidazolesuccinocarboxamide synthase [Salisediminibacterium beveridgei]AOM83966.1 Phosphoribosylaminoimidazole-succinocarboxamide synthase [Salisediminibacterium beveridgei]